MKKLILLVMAILLISCDDRPYTPASTDEVKEAGSFLKEYTVRGEAHEYLVYTLGKGEGITHLPNCKYCKVTGTKRTEFLLEGEELHEVWIINCDTAQITDHCDDCKYCMMQNPEGNPD